MAFVHSQYAANIIIISRHIVDLNIPHSFLLNQVQFLRFFDNRHDNLLFSFAEWLRLWILAELVCFDGPASLKPGKRKLKDVKKRSYQEHLFVRMIFFAYLARKASSRSFGQNPLLICGPRRP